MDKLWAPWRSKYVSTIAGRPQKCVFCRMAREKKDAQNHIFLRRKYCYSVLNLYPYNNGHMLIVPYRHVKDLGKLTKAEREEIMDLLQETQACLQKAIHPAGFNIGINLGRAAGAGFPGHLHIHLVPRWRGDVNFMPVVSGTKVVSQSLKILLSRLHDAYKKRH